MKRTGWLLTALIILNSLGARAAGSDWLDRREAFARDKGDALKVFEELHFPAHARMEKPRSGPRTEALILIRDGELLYERYDRGFGPDRKHIAWSISKSVMSLLYGVALKEKKFQLDESICKFGRLANPDYCRVTFRHLLQWSSGNQWLEEYERSNRPRFASILAMIYGEGRHDMSAFVLRHPLIHEPGTAWRYSSGDSMLLSYLLARMYEGRDVGEVLKDKLFHPLGVRHALFERDGAGTLAGAYYLFIAPHDLARLGVLLLRKGRTADGQHLLDPSWTDFIRELPEAFKKNRLDYHSRHISGGHWWLNDHVQAGTEVPPLPALPRDTIFAQGHWGQFLLVVPSERLVVVRMGDTRDGSMNVAKFAESVARLLDLSSNTNERARPAKGGP